MPAISSSLAAGGRSCCRLVHRLRLRRHAFYIGASPALPAIGTRSRSGSGLRIGLPDSSVNSWAMSHGASIRFCDFSLHPPPGLTVPTIACPPAGRVRKTEEQPHAPQKLPDTLLVQVGQSGV